MRRAIAAKPALVTLSTPSGSCSEASKPSDTTSASGANSAIAASAVSSAARTSRSPQPGAGTALVGIADEERVVVAGIGMQRDEEHVGPLVEDALRAVAVMDVDIEDGDAAEREAQMLRGDRGVVEIAEAAGLVGIGVMAGRAAEPIGGARPAEHQRGGMRRDMGAGDRRLPGSGADRAGRIGGVIADQTGEPDRAAAHVAAGMDVRYDLLRRAGEGLPAVMDGGEEVEIGLAVHRLAWAGSEIVGRDDG